MASRCSPLRFLPSVLVMALVLMMTWPFIEGDAGDLYLKGEVGGNVTIHCPFDKERTVTLFYFQRDAVYVNGFHRSHDISGSKTWKNTRVDQQTITVHMLDLNASHIGDYQCIIQYSGRSGFHKTTVHLKVTANYSTPEVKVWCEDGSSCLVTCAAHRGYPGSGVMWNVSERQTWREVKANETRDPDTMLVNSTSTAYFNCSKGVTTFLSCSVAGVTSETVSVCAPDDSSVPYDTTRYRVIPVAVFICVTATAIGYIGLLLWKKKKSRAEAARKTKSEKGLHVEKETFIKTEAP